MQTAPFFIELHPFYRPRGSPPRYYIPNQWSPVGLLDISLLWLDFSLGNLNSRFRLWIGFVIFDSSVKISKLYQTAPFPWSFTFSWPTVSHSRVKESLLRLSWAKVRGFCTQYAKLEPNWPGFIKFCVPL